MPGEHFSGWRLGGAVVEGTGLFLSLSNLIAGVGRKFFRKQVSGVAVALGRSDSLGISLASHCVFYSEANSVPATLTSLIFCELHSFLRKLPY